MDQDVVILIAEGDESQFALISKNLARAGIFNQIVRFDEGRQVLDFLSAQSGPAGLPKAYLLLLDIRLPGLDGIAVLDHLKADTVLKRIPVVMLTAAADQHEIDRCHELGCSIYFVKPLEYGDFTNAIRELGLFLSVVSIPEIGD